MAARHIATTAMKPHLYYMSAWFCPFAHRATLALEHHADHVTWEWIEALGWEKRRATDDALQTDHENWYHFKAPELMKHNSLGMVPTLVSEATFTEDASKGPVKPPVRESLIAIEFVDELVAGGDTPIMPSCPYERAKMRVAADVVNKKVCSKYYHVLVRQDPAEQREGFEALVAGLDELALSSPAVPSTAGVTRRDWWTTRCSRGRTDFRCSSTTGVTSTQSRETRRGCGRTTRGSTPCTRCRG